MRVGACQRLVAGKKKWREIERRRRYVLVEENVFVAEDLTLSLRFATANTRQHLYALSGFSYILRCVH